MSERQGVITIGEKGDHIITAFVPPLEEDMLFEATSSALPMHEVLHPKDSRQISGVVYEAGDPKRLEEKLERLRDEVEAATGYEAKAGIKKLGATAAK